MKFIDFFESRLKQIQDDFSQLKPKERIKVLTELLSFVIGKKKGEDI